MYHRRGSRHWHCELGTYSRSWRTLWTSSWSWNNPGTCRRSGEGPGDLRSCMRAHIAPMAPATTGSCPHVASFAASSMSGSRVIANRPFVVFHSPTIPAGHRADGLRASIPHSVRPRRAHCSQLCRRPGDGRDTWEHDATRRRRVGTSAFYSVATSRACETDCSSSLVFSMPTPFGNLSDSA